MFKSKKWKIIVPSTLLLILTACTQVRDRQGNLIEENIIRLADGWKYDGLINSFIVWPLAQLINFLSQPLGVVLAILVVSLLLRLILFKPSLNSQIANQKMQMLQPKVAQIQAKYKGRTDQQSQMQMYQEQQNLYKKYDVNMGAAFLPTLLQLPVLMAMWSAVNRSEAVINGTFLGNSLSITPREGIANGHLFYITIFAILIVVNAIQMLLPQYLAKKKAKKYPNQKAAPQPGQGMMYFMIAFMAFIGLSLTTALSIYLIISALVQIAQTLYIHNYMDKKGMHAL